MKVNKRIWSMVIICKKKRTNETEMYKISEEKLGVKEFRYLESETGGIKKIDNPRIAQCKIGINSKLKLCCSSSIVWKIEICCRRYLYGVSLCMM